MSNRPRAERPSEAVMRMTDGGKTEKVTVIDGATLIAAAKTAKRTHRNRQLSDELTAALDPEGVNVVVWSMIHNDVEVRVRLLCKIIGSMRPVEAWLDIPFKTFDRCKVVEARTDLSQEEVDAAL